MKILAEPKKFGRRKAAPAPPLKELGNDPVSEKPMVVKDGRFGPYVTDGETNASLRKGDTVENITIERAAELLQIRRDAGPAKKARKGAKKAPAKKAAKKADEEGGEEGAGEEGRQEGRTARVRVLIAGAPRAGPVTWTRWRNSARCRCPGSKTSAADAPTEPAPAVGSPGDKPGLHVRLFGSSQFFHLWLTQVARPPATGSASSPSPRWPPTSPRARRRRAVGLVMSARIVPGFFLGPAAGVFVDRFDRKQADGHLRPRPGRRARHACRSSTPSSGWCSRRSCSSASRCCGRRPRRRRSRTSCRPTTSRPPTRCRWSRPTAPCRSPARSSRCSPVSSRRSASIDALDVLRRPTRWRIAFYVDAGTFLAVGRS